jgi:hypothetical protein
MMTSRMILAILFLSLSAMPVRSIVIIGGVGQDFSVTSSYNGTLTSISQGNGVTLSPNPITSSGTVSQDFSYAGIYSALWNHYFGINATEINASQIRGNISAPTSIRRGGVYPTICAGDASFDGILANGSFTCNPDSGGGSGTVTSVSAGEGLTASPEPITTTGTLSANFSAFNNRVLSSGNNITTGTIGDARLSSNVSFLGLTNIWTSILNYFANINASMINASFFNGNHSAPSLTNRGGVYVQDCDGTDKVDEIKNTGFVTCGIDVIGNGTINSISQSDGTVLLNPNPLVANGTIGVNYTKLNESYLVKNNVTSTQTLALDTSRRPNTNSSTFVTVSVNITSNDLPASPDDGLVRFQTSPNNTTWTNIGQWRLTMDSVASGDIIVMSPSSFIVPQSYYYRINTTVLAGTPMFDLSLLVEMTI